MDVHFELQYIPEMGKKNDFGIGIIGSGFIVRSCHLPAYREAGYQVVAIATRPEDIAQAEDLARTHQIPQVYDDIRKLAANPDVEIVDIAYPPHLQLEVIEQILPYRKKGILAQKPLATNYQDAKKIVDLCQRHGVTLAVNQNGRYDPAVQATRFLLQRGLLGKPVIATIELRFKPHWQHYILDYERLMFLNMSVHHLDQFRYWFGLPERIYAHGTTYPGCPYKGEYLGAYILEYSDGLLASAWDDGFTWDPPGFGVFYKIEGTEGVAKLSIGWPSGGPSTMSFYSKKIGEAWITPDLKETWFPGAFKYTMGELMKALEQGTEPENSGTDNLKTMAMVEACYVSHREKRAVPLREILES
ncbi:MAG: Gfo/Idh/MocA family oxidoreductase [Atribacterota bacterium]